MISGFLAIAGLPRGLVVVRVVEVLRGTSAARSREFPDAVHSIEGAHMTGGNVSRPKPRRVYGVEACFVLNVNSKHGAAQ